jgi:hypothetical protein
MSTYGGYDLTGGVMEDGYQSEIQMTDSDYKRFFEFEIFVRDKRLATWMRQPTKSKQ